MNPDWSPSLGDGTGPEVQTAAGSVRPTIQDGIGVMYNLSGIMNDTVFPASSATFDRLPGRIASRHDVDGMRNGIVHLTINSRSLFTP